MTTSPAGLNVSMAVQTNDLSSTQQNLFDTVPPTTLLTSDKLAFDQGNVVNPNAHLKPYQMLNQLRDRSADQKGLQPEKFNLLRFAKSSKNPTPQLDSSSQRSALTFKQPIWRGACDEGLDAALCLRGGDAFSPAGSDSDIPQPIKFDELDWGEPKEKFSGETFDVYATRVPGQPLSALKGVARINKPYHEMLPLMDDVKNYPKWMDGITRTKVVETDDRGLPKRYATIADARWPFSPRYDVIEVTKRTESATALKIEARSNPKLSLPNEFLTKKESKMERLQHSATALTLEKVGEKESKLTFEIYVQADKQVNGWFLSKVDPLIPNLMKASMSKLGRFIGGE